MSKLFFAFFAALSIATVSAQDQITVYTGSDCTGFTKDIPKIDYSNLADAEADNIIRSLEIQGHWLMYDLINFNAEVDAAVEYIEALEHSCQNLGVTAGTLSSLRSVGVSDGEGGSLDTFTLYWQPTYQGNNFMAVAENVPSLFENTFYSLIIVGKTGWTIYEKPEYDGFSLCILPDQADPYNLLFIPDLMDFTTQIPYNFIKSVQYGCHSENIVRVSSV